MIKCFFLLLSLCCILNIQAQEIKPAKLQSGLELDVLPYAICGYFGADWLDYNQQAG